MFLWHFTHCPRIWCCWPPAQPQDPKGKLWEALSISQALPASLSLLLSQSSWDFAVSQLYVGQLMGGRLGGQMPSTW